MIIWRKNIYCMYDVRWNIYHLRAGTSTVIALEQRRCNARTFIICALEHPWSVALEHLRSPRWNTVPKCAGTSALEHPRTPRWNIVPQCAGTSALEHRRIARWNIQGRGWATFSLRCSSALLSMFQRKIIDEPWMAGLAHRCSSADHRCSSALYPPISRCSSAKCPMWCR